MLLKELLIFFFVEFLTRKEFSEDLVMRELTNKIVRSMVMKLMNSSGRQVCLLFIVSLYRLKF